MDLKLNELIEIHIIQEEIKTNHLDWKPTGNPSGDIVDALRSLESFRKLGFKLEVSANQLGYTLSSKEHHFQLSGVQMEELPFSLCKLMLSIISETGKIQEPTVVADYIIKTERKAS